MAQQVQIQERQISVPAQRRWRDDWPVSAVAGGVAAVGWLVATQVAGVELRLDSGGATREVGLVSAVVTAVVVSMVGAGLLRLLERRTARAWAVWVAVAGSVLVVSLTGPSGAASLGAGVCLALLHLAVGAVVIGGLWRRRRDGVAA